MKKIYIALAVIVTALLSSCMQEKSFEDAKVGENEIVITLQGAPATRASEMSLVQKGATIELACDENGHKLFLEETIEDLNRAWAPVTRGTPAYTENIGVLYKDNMSVYASALGEATFQTMDSDVYARKTGYGTGEGWRYNHNYASDPWAGADNHDFYFRMPVNMTGVSGLSYGKSGNDLTITFSYTSPTTAAQQQDIIFAARNITKEEHLNSLPNGAPVLFNHALTGVKFAIANPDEAMITSVEFTGLKGQGTCTIKPAKETDYSDTGTYSSATAVDWGTPTVVENATYSAEFDEVVSFNSGAFENNGNYPSSFAGAGSAQTNNLNDADATQTFWFIPQAMTNDVVLHIVYTYGGVESEGYIDFGKTLANVEWKAGQLRTYTIRVDDVNVKIEDTVTAGTSGIVGSTKNAVTITNTGNTDAFIRAAIVGQWVIDKTVDGKVERQIMFGFTDEVNNLYQVESWYEDQFETHAGAHGEFVGLAGYSNTAKGTSYGNPYPAENGWYYKDGYYYL